MERACFGKLHWYMTHSANRVMCIKHQQDRSTHEAPALWIASKASSLCTLSMRESTTAEGFRALVRSVRTLFELDSHTMSRANTTTNHHCKLQQHQESNQRRPGRLLTTLLRIMLFHYLKNPETTALGNSLKSRKPCPPSFAYFLLVTAGSETPSWSTWQDPTA